MFVKERVENQRSIRVLFRNSGLGVGAKLQGPLQVDFGSWADETGWLFQPLAHP